MQIERDIGKISWILTSKKSCLAPEVVEMLCYLNINLDNLEWNKVDTISPEDIKAHFPTGVLERFDNLLAGIMESHSSDSDSDDDYEIEVE